MSERVPTSWLFTPERVRANVRAAIAQELNRDPFANWTDERVGDLTERIVGALELMQVVQYPGDVRVVEVAKGLRMLKAGDMWVTKSMVNQFDRMLFPEIDPLGKVRIGEGAYSETFAIGPSRAGGELCLGKARYESFEEEMFPHLRLSDTGGRSGKAKFEKDLYLAQVKVIAALPLIVLADCA